MESSLRFHLYNQSVAIGSGRVWSQMLLVIGLVSPDFRFGEEYGNIAYLSCSPYKFN